MNEEGLEGHDVRDSYNLDDGTINVVMPERENQLDQLYSELES